MTAVGEALKTEGQHQSTQGLDDAALAAFVTIIESVRVGDLVSVNDLRRSLDEAAIPERARGGLFAKAVKAGALRPVTVRLLGVTVPMRIPSTGPSARTATVRVYERTGGASW